MGWVNLVPGEMFVSSYLQVCHMRYELRCNISNADFVLESIFHKNVICEDDKLF